MSEIVTKAAEMLNERISGKPFEGRARFVFEGEGAMVIDAAGARFADDDAAEDDADVTLTASPETFRAIFDGELNPTAAFMTGRLTLSGDMGMAMRLSSLLG
jgi:putative sterol carrier protein